MQRQSKAGSAITAFLALALLTLALTVIGQFILNTAREITDKPLGLAEANSAPQPRHDFPITVSITSTENHESRPPLQLYWIDSNRSHTHKAYLEAKRNRHYTISVTNNTTGRIGLVIAIDGRNIITGDYSTLSPQEAMYIINSLDSATYTGWRTSQDQVNTFYFTDAPDSYAAAFGDQTAMGVIAVAAYQETRPIPLRKPDLKYDRGVAPQAAPKSAPSEQPGTGFGDPEHSPSIKVQFNPDPRTIVKYLIKYEWRETLCSKGIIDCSTPKNRLWDDEHYAPYPPNRQR